jgi:hypothetical protein
MFNFMGTCVIPDRYQYKENEFGSIYQETIKPPPSPSTPKSPLRRSGSSRWDTLRRNSVFLTAAPPLPETPPSAPSKKTTDEVPCLPTKVKRGGRGVDGDWERDLMMDFISPTFVALLFFFQNRNLTSNIIYIYVCLMCIN